MAKAPFKTLVATTSVLTLLAGCANEAGSNDGFAFHDNDGFGSSVNTNAGIQTGQINVIVALAERFNKEVKDTVNFAFNSAVLDPQARAALQQQASWIRQFPELRFRVYGHTDLVGSDSYNKRLGMRRANAVVNFLVGQGISRSRLEAVVSYGETQPLIATQQPELLNRRTVTEVVGFAGRKPTQMSGKYAEIIQREYIKSAIPGPVLTTGGLSSIDAGGN